MNAFSVIMKVLAALAVIAGAVFVVIVYGEKIKNFIQKLMQHLNIEIKSDSDFVDESDLADEEDVADEQDFDEE